MIRKPVDKQPDKADNYNHSKITEREQFGVNGENGGADGLLLLSLPGSTISGGDGVERGEI